jgi:TnpA family transposase
MMNYKWNTDDIIEQFTLLAPEISFLGSNDPHNHLGKALLLKFFQNESRFPEDLTEIHPSIVKYVAQQLDLPHEVIHKYDWNGSRLREHRRDIRELLGFHPATLADQDALRAWLMDEVLSHEHRPAYLEKLVYQRLRRSHIEPPSKKQIERLIKSAKHRHEQAFFAQTAARLSETVRANLRQLIYKKEDLVTDLDLGEQVDDDDDPHRYPIHNLKSGAGDAKVNNIKKVADRLKLLQEIGLPPDLFVGMPLRFLRQYQQQTAVESISHLRRREKEQEDKPQTYTMLAAFSWVRQREITDQLVDLFIRVLKDIRLRAEYREERKLLTDFIRVGGKQQLLFRLAEAMWDNPNGIIREVLYPLVGQERLRSLVHEAKNNGNYRHSVQTRISGSYTHHYRQILPPLLEVLTFRSNNDQYKPLIEAIEVVAAYLEEKDPFYPKEQEIPMDDVIQNRWQSWIYQQDRRGRRRIRRVRYELCVLQSLRDKLRCKEIWVEGADRYRNPDEDVPADFSDKREEYYDALTLPLQADEFIRLVKKQLEVALKMFHDTLPTNPAVEILPKGGGWIRVSPLLKQKEPANLGYLKNHIKQHWWMTSLLDIIKEADFRIGFTDSFESLTGQERLPRTELKKRLLLCLFGLGTNTGLTSVSMGNHGVSYANLQYIRRRFVSKDALRHAIGRVVDATLAVKQPHIWGETTTWCASDSKQFGAWNQNLRAQWHKRYRQAGVMVYWHTTKQSLCIYSQLKAPSSSEVASMIEGVLRHCTAMQVDRNYVDTHGQSEVAFAFCNLLGFQLMPRFKDLHKQKLSLPDEAAAGNYPNLKLILQRAIDWELITKQYDEMVKYATALRLGTAEAEAILKRFTRHNRLHPTYKALSELGRAIKTIFLCSYLTHEAVRKEIQEGLNVIENWNSANGFIFYGKRGEISTNDVDAQEVAILSMHLLQSCLVYVNTLMTQEVLAEPKWYERMTEADWRGLTPLFYLHVNPYGLFDLDMETRIPFMGAPEGTM